MIYNELIKRTWFAILISSAVVVPRSLLIASSHSESFDDRYHIRRGLGFLTDTIVSKKLTLNDPPLGEAIIALPVYLINIVTGYPLSEYRGEGKPISLESFSLIFAAWKSLLFSLSVGLAFRWCRQIYGLRSAWLVTILLTFEPSLAAHIPIPSLDVLGMEAVLLACYLAWKFTANPTPRRAVVLGAGTAMALLIKHTAVIIPLVILLMAALQWFVLPRLEREKSPVVPVASSSRRLRALALAGISGAFFLWVFLLFDRTPPLYYAMDDASRAASHRPELRRMMELRWPAGIYLSSVWHASYHARMGHPSYLFGEKSWRGWWYYLPSVALYKVPIGIWFLLVLAMLSVRKAPPKWDEWGLALPAVAWGFFLINSRLSIGFRHFLPCYLFLIMLASRCASASSRTWLIACCGAVIAAVSHSLYFHPNYLCYINFPRDKVYLEISDSNVDWGQSLKQIRSWLVAHPSAPRPITLDYFGIADESHAVDQLIGNYLGKSVILLGNDEPLPTRGLLIISPALISGQFEENDRFGPLRRRTPDDIIGDCMLVFDMEQFSKLDFVRVNGSSTPR